VRVEGCKHRPRIKKKFNRSINATVFCTVQQGAENGINNAKRHQQQDP